MKEKQKIRELIKPQVFNQDELDDKLVVPYCSSNYTSNGSDVTSCNGYSTSFWCWSSPTEEDDILL